MRCSKELKPIFFEADNIDNWNGEVFPEELCFYRKKKQWRCDLSGQPLRTRRFGRYRLVPDSSGKEEDEDERVEGFLSSVFYLQAKSPVNAGDRRGRYLSESKREVLSI